MTAHRVPLSASSGGWRSTWCDPVAGMILVVFVQQLARHVRRPENARGQSRAANQIEIVELIESRPK